MFTLVPDHSFVRHIAHAHLDRPRIPPKLQIITFRLRHAKFKVVSKNVGQSKEGKKGKTVEKSFSLTEEEITLLLHVIIDYKMRWAADGLGWETIKSKYEEIAERFQERYPKESSGVSDQEFPNSKDPSGVTEKNHLQKLHNRAAEL